VTLPSWGYGPCGSFKKGKSPNGWASGAKGDGSGENTTFDTAASTAGSVYTDDTSTDRHGDVCIKQLAPIGIARNDDHFSGVFNGAFTRFAESISTVLPAVGACSATLGEGAGIENVKLKTVTSQATGVQRVVGYNNLAR
jgi:hypothetical protein